MSAEARFGVDADGSVAYWTDSVDGSPAPERGSPAAGAFSASAAAAFQQAFAAAAAGATVLVPLELAGGTVAHCTMGRPGADGIVHVELCPMPRDGQARGRRRDEAEALSVLSRVVADLGTHHPGDDGLEVALGHLARFMEADRAVVSHVHPSASEPLASWGELGTRWPLSPRLLAAWMPRLRMDQIVHIPDVDDMGLAGTPEARALRERGVRSALVLPLNGGRRSGSRDGLDAFLLIEADEPQRWGPWVASLGRIVGGMVHSEIARRQESVLRAGAAAQLEVVMRHSGSVLLVLDSVGAVGFVSSSLRRVLGWAPDQWIGRPLSRLVHPRDRHVLSAALAPDQEGSATVVEVRVPDEHARWRWMSVGVGGHVSDTAAAGRVVHLHDVTDRVRLEAEERRLLEMVAATPDFIGTFTAQGALVSVNPAGLALTGLREEQAVGTPLSALLPAWASKILTTKAIPDAVAHGSWTGETAIRNADGRDVPVSQVVLAHRDADGDVAFLSTMMRDISEQRAAEQLLRRHSLQLLTVAELGQRALRQRERDDLLREVLLAARAMFDAERAMYLEVVHDDSPEVRVHDEDGEVHTVRLAASLDGVLRGRAPAVIPRLDRRDAPEALAQMAQGYGSAAYAVVGGALRPGGVLLILANEPGGLAEDDAHALDSLAGLVSTAMDRLEGESRLRQAERLEAVGRLAGGIAHDFNNLLTVVLGNAERLSGDAASAGEEIRRAGTSAARLVEQLLTFSRGKPTCDEVADLRALLLEFEPLLRRVVREDIELEVSTCDTGCPVGAGSHQLEQVLMNLVVNARDATPAGGRIAVTLTSDGDPPMVCLRVSDTGQGIQESVRSRLFEPYFTTKGSDGSGLGLATVHSIVAQAGGRVAVESAPGMGATFVVELPMEDRRQAPREAPAPLAQERPAGARRVMVVEDQAAIRSLVVESLRREGLDVIEAVNGAAAERLAQEQAWIDLVVTDVVMPEQNGPALVEALRRRWPELPVVYMSGYSGDDVPSGDERAGFLQKPFSLSDVREAVWRFLGGPQ